MSFPSSVRIISFYKSLGFVVYLSSFYPSSSASPLYVPPPSRCLSLSVPQLAVYCNRGGRGSSNLLANYFMVQYSLGKGEKSIELYSVWVVATRFYISSITSNRREPRNQGPLYIQQRGKGYREKL